MVKKLSTKTTIVLSRYLRDRLAALGTHDETFEDIISKLVENQEQLKHE